MSSASRSHSVLILGTDPTAERLVHSLEAAGVRARRVSIEKAIESVLANPPRLTLLLAEAARDAGADFCDALAVDSRTAAVEVLAVTTRSPPPEVRLNRHAAVIDPALGVSRITALTMGLLQWGESAGSDGKPLSMAHRVSALLHILEQRMGPAPSRSLKPRSSRPPLRSVPARENRLSRPPRDDPPTLVVVHPTRAVSQERAMGAQAASALASETQVEADLEAVVPEHVAAAISEPPAPAESEPESGAESESESAWGGEADSADSAEADFSEADFQLEPPSASPAPGSSTGQGREPSLSFGLPDTEREARQLSRRPAPMSLRTELLSVTAPQPAAAPAEAERAAAGAERKPRADWLARGVGVAALVASVLVLYQQSKKGEPGALPPTVIELEREVPGAKAQAQAVGEPPVASKTHQEKAHREQAEGTGGAEEAQVELETAEPEGQAPLEVEEFALEEVEQMQAQAQAQQGATGEPWQQRLRRANALLDEGLYYARQKNHRMAALRYRQALEIAPHYLRALRLSARVSLQLLDKRAAVEAAERLVDAHPAESSHHLLLGDAYERAGMAERARQAWRAAAESGNALARKRLNAAVANDPAPQGQAPAEAL